jgi:DNA repair exonuclease SbcCD nuclease subunit
MSNKIIGIGFSDLHMHKYTQFNTPIEGINGRLYQSMLVLSYMSKIANKYKVPIFFPGDWFETQAHLENEVGALAMHCYKRLFHKRGIPVFAISGNHDMSQRNGKDTKSPSHLVKFKVFDKFYLMDDITSCITPGEKLFVQGVPYMDNDADTMAAIKDRAKSTKLAPKNSIKILMLHQDFPGAKTPAGFECKEYKALDVNLNKLFKPWDFVLCGHIHKPQKIAKNAWMLGSPIHQITSDEGTKMGYWKLFSDKTIKFCPLNKKFPTFITLNKGQKPFNKKDYFILPPVDDLVEKNIKKDKFSLNNSKDKLAKRYLAQKGIKSKIKLTALRKILSEV